MGALGADACHSLDLGKYLFAVAVARERVHAPQHLPVRFRNGERHGADLDLRHAIADKAVRFRCTDGDGGICAHGEDYPQVGNERASTKELRSAKIRGRILALSGRSFTCAVPK